MFSMTLMDSPLIGPYAASLHRLAMSAPEYPDVLSAISTNYNMDKLVKEVVDPGISEGGGLGR